jgi:hypothetical protein
VPDGLKLTVSVTSLQSGAEGFELLTSTVQSQSTIIADVRYCSKTQHLKWVSLSSSSLPCTSKTVPACLEALTRIQRLVF